MLFIIIDRCGYLWGTPDGVPHWPKFTQLVKLSAVPMKLTYMHCWLKLEAEFGLWEGHFCLILLALFWSDVEQLFENAPFVGRAELRTAPPARPTRDASSAGNPRDDPLARPPEALPARDPGADRPGERGKRVGSPSGDGGSRPSRAACVHGRLQGHECQRGGLLRQSPFGSAGEQ